MFFVFFPLIPHSHVHDPLNPGDSIPQRAPHAENRLCMCLKRQRATWEKQTNPANDDASDPMKGGTR